MEFGPLALAPCPVIFLHAGNGFGKSKNFAGRMGLNAYIPDPISTKLLDRPCCNLHTPVSALQFVFTYMALIYISINLCYMDMPILYSLKRTY